MSKTSKQLFAILFGIVTVALVTTVVRNGNNAADVIRAFGRTFSDTLSNIMNARA